VLTGPTRGRRQIDGMVSSAGANAKDHHWWAERSGRDDSSRIGSYSERDRRAEAGDQYAGARWGLRLADLDPSGDRSIVSGDCDDHERQRLQCIGRVGRTHGRTPCCVLPRTVPSATSTPSCSSSHQTRASSSQPVWH